MIKRNYVYAFAAGFGRFSTVGPRQWHWGFGKTINRKGYLDVGPFRVFGLRLRNTIKFAEKVQYRMQSLTDSEWKRATQEFPELFHTRSKG
jgi:hypothetical protein